MFYAKLKKKKGPNPLQFTNIKQKSHKTSPPDKKKEKPHAKIKQKESNAQRRKKKRKEKIRVTKTV